MKNNMSRIKRAVTGLVMLAGLAAGLNAWTARAGGFDGGAVTPTGALVNGATNTVVWTNTGTAFQLHQGCPLVLEPVFTGTSQSSNVWFGLDLSDGTGTNWSTTTPITVTNAVNGSLTVTGLVVVPASAFQGCKYARWDSLGTLATNGVVPVELIWSQFY